MEEKNVTDERQRRSDSLLPSRRSRSMSQDHLFPQQPGTAGNAPLTRKQLRELERVAQLDAKQKHGTKQRSTKQSAATPSVEAPTTPVLADLFTPHSMDEPTAAHAPVVVERAPAIDVAVVVEAAPVAYTAPVLEAAPVITTAPVVEASLPSRRSLRAQQANAAAVPAIPTAPASASVLGATAPAAGAPTVSERLFTAPIATVPASTASVASDLVAEQASSDEPLSIFGITPDPAIASTSVAVAPAARVAHDLPRKKRAKSGKAATSARAPKPTKVATAPASRAPRGSAVKSKRVWVSSAAFAPSGTPRRRTKAAASKAFSFVAMLFAGAILVGVSVPSNAFVDGDAAITAAIAPEADLAALSNNVRPSQSLAVSGEVESELAAHDSIKVISYAEVLALQYAGVDYDYNATVGAVRWPFPYTVPITDGFGDRVGGFHKGTDFAAASGTPIYAIADGTVDLIQADWSGYGYHAIISHVINGQQVESLYAHMITDSSPLVVGQEIKAGDFIGLVGETGIAYGAHLHFEVHLDGVPVDPYAWLTTNAVD
ncbi:MULTISPECIES: peptidoglycan DD-metalloendopeptidase family protein [unclassified Salinibacterium]|uniref:M23 family metallopeptidase n=1 Tax=unclassified Salinibacterium TaxID=2632331 RepID=UPI0027DA3332|nr:MULTISPECIES: peptidoglycan DD-metalloendopeptidase family protein [unclassified Salinibacterium]